MSILLGISGSILKLCFDESLDQYKAQLVAIGNCQECGEDYKESCPFCQNDNGSYRSCHSCIQGMVFAIIGCQECFIAWRS